MGKALGIITSSASHMKVEGMEEYRPIGAFSFLGRYRVIDFPISNMSNSGLDRILVYVRGRVRSLAEHLGTGRHYNINSKRGKLQLLFSESSSLNDIYNTDIASFMEYIEILDRTRHEYVVIAPSYMVYSQNYDTLLQNHIDSGADITLLYHKTDNAREAFLNCNVLNLNRQKGLLSIERNLGNAKDKNIFMDTYIMKTKLFVELIRKAAKLSSMYTLADIVNLENEELDIRGVAHKGFFASVEDVKSYYDANLALLDPKLTQELFPANWPIYIKTTDSCPTQYYEGASVRNSYVSNGCQIEGTVENSVIGRSVVIKKGAVVKNSVVLAYSEIGEGVHRENQVVDKWAKVIHAKEIVAAASKPGYIKRDDTV